jgi:hypothetical protein
MKPFLKLMSALAIPLLLINLFGDIVAGIWLAVLREWRILGQGIALAVAGGLLLSIAMLPGLLLDAPAALFCKKRNRAGFYFFCFLSLCYTLGVLALWCITVLAFFVERASQSSFIPTLIWSYGAATVPVAWLAQKDREAGSTGAIISTFFCQTAYLLVVLTALVARVSPLALSFLLFGVVMLVALVVELRMAAEEYKALHTQMTP